MAWPLAESSGEMIQLLLPAPPPEPASGFSAAFAASIARSGEQHSTEERLLAKALGDLIQRWINRGQFERLKCLELLFVRGWPNKEVAARLGVTEQTVANYKHQTIGQLQRLVRDAGLRDEHVVELSSGGE